MDTIPPRLDYRGNDYWHTDDPEALARLLLLRVDLHEWVRAANDKKRGRELLRFYHKPAGYQGYIASSGIVVELSGTVRLVGDDPARCRRILEQLATGQAVEGVQSCLF